MTPPLKPNDEAGRLKLLRQTELLDTAPEVHYDNLTQLAAQTCEAPVALVSFVDADRVWFKSKLGTDAPQCTRDDSYCGHVVNERKLVVCLDTTADWRFSDSPFTRQAGFRFYMGHPIIPPGTRHVIGTMCIIDTKPRDSVPQEMLDKFNQLVSVVQGMVSMALQLAERIESMSLFVAKVSHELRTPLNGILGMSEILKDELKATPAQMEMVENISSCAEHNLRIVNDILDFAKLQQGKMHLDHNPFDLRQCIESAFACISSLPKSKKLDMGYVLPSDVTIVGDEARLRQVLLNLLSNAVKFTNAGVVSLEVRVEEVGEEFAVHFAVTDTGIGISQAQRQCIMKEFGQVHLTNKQMNKQGTGLGLVISQYLCNAMGTELALESERDVGSKFSFTLQGPWERKAAPMETMGKSVLLVGPRGVQETFLRQHCEALGMEVTTVRSVEVGRMLTSSPLPQYNLSAVLCAAEALDPEEHADILRDSPVPWVVVVNQREPHGTPPNVPSLTAPLMRSRLVDLLTPPPRLTRSDTLILAAEEPFAHLKVLSADDVKTNQLIIQHFLQRLGVRHPDVSWDGCQAVDAASAKQYDLILMDLEMPRMNGLEASKLIKEKWPSTFIVLVTAHYSIDNDTSAVDLVMHKPVRINKIKEVLKMVSSRPYKPGTCPQKDASVVLWDSLSPDHQVFLRDKHPDAGQGAVCDLFVCSARSCHSSSTSSSAPQSVDSGLQVPSGPLVVSGAATSLATESVEACVHTAQRGIAAQISEPSLPHRSSVQSRVASLTVRLSSAAEYPNCALPGSSESPGQEPATESTMACGVHRSGSRIVLIEKQTDSAAKIANQR